MSGKGGCTVNEIDKPSEPLGKQALLSSKQSESRAAGKGFGSGREGNTMVQEPGSQPEATGTAEEPVLDQPAGKPLQDPSEAQEPWSDWTDNWWNHDSGYWYGNRDWSWGLGSRHDWNTWEAGSGNYQWRRRSESLESLSNGSATLEALPEPTTPKPIERRTSSLDSEMMAAFNRLPTTLQQETRKPQDPDPSSKLEAQNLDPKFEQVKTPQKQPGLPSMTPDKKQETPSTSPGPSPSSTASPGASSTNLEVEAKKQEGQKQASEEDKTREDAASKESTKERSQEKLEDMKKRKMAAHARYMRYYRSVHGTGLSCTICIMLTYRCFYLSLEMVHALCSLRKQEDAD